MVRAVECFFACQAAGKSVSDDVWRNGRKVGEGPLLDGQVADDGAYHIRPLRPGHVAVQILIGRQILDQFKGWVGHAHVGIVMGHVDVIGRGEADKPVMLRRAHEDTFPIGVSLGYADDHGVAIQHQAVGRHVIGPSLEAIHPLADHGLVGAFVRQTIFDE